jgi:hypothetical protein
VIKRKRTSSTSSLDVCLQYNSSMTSYIASVLQHLPCSQFDSSFDAWWDKAVLTVSGDAQKGLNSLIILGAWTIWKHRNDCVFDGAAPRLSTALNLAREEALLWSIAGAKELSLHTARDDG